MKFCVIGFGRWGKNLHRTLVNLAGEENVLLNLIKNTRNINNSISSLEEIVNNTKIKM